MNRRLIFGALAVLVLVLVAGSIGTAVYNAGVHAGLADAAQQAVASGQPAPVVVDGYRYSYGPYWHGGWGFGFFGIIFWIFGILLLIGLVRAAFGWGRWRGPGGPGGYGGRPGHGPGYGPGREMAEEWHRELHRRQAESTERATS